MSRLVPLALCASLALGAGVQAARAAQVRADLFLATDDGPGALVGSAVFRDTADGARIALDLKGLPPGQHGLHVHANGSCAAIMKDGKMMAAGAAGAHLDPDMTGKHEGPMGMGHLGDLPAITVGSSGTDHEALTAPRIKDVTQLAGRSLMIHVGGDNYSDQPAPLGGGAARLACGLIK